MARGNSKAQSELSDQLQRKARDLRRQNEDERKEVDTNQNEYERARKYAVARAEEEVAEEFAKAKLELDEAAQAKREADAAQAEKDAEAELDRERTDEERLEVFSAKVEKDIKGSAMDYEEWDKTKWFKAIKESKDPKVQLIFPYYDDNSNERLYLSSDYIKASIDKAPAAIKDMITEALKGFTANGRDDAFPGEKAEKLYYGLNKAYNDVALGKGNIGAVDPSDLRNKGARVPQELTPDRHEKGMKSLNKVDEYLAKVLRGSSKHIVDKSGNKV
jgi:hypothetical protein